MSIDAATAAWLGMQLLVACAGTWLARRYALNRQLLDQPGERRSHVVATPRGGGIGIVVALMAGIAWWASTHGWTPLLAASAIGLAMVAGIGWVDDHRPLSPWPRLMVHALAATLLALAVLRQGGTPAVALQAWLLAMLLVNVWNFMDGIDGLAASQAAIAAVAFAWHAFPGPGAPLAMGLAAACLGFLPFNLPPARIFLGDVGSGALGFALAAVVAAVLIEGPAHPAVLALPLSAFLIDAILTLGLRMLRGERWWQPHVQHAYQRWAHQLGRHGPVTLAYACWTAAASAIMLSCNTTATRSMGIVVVWYSIGSFAWWGLRRDPGSRDRE
jgi:UDP-N-acetylmuramyl pentapeptide phosphotransferase/UDP-N-acetylglucosamine-1-phosphate transferase